MVKEKFKDAGEYIDHLYDKYFGERDRSSFPNSIMDDFDMVTFANNCCYKDFHNILMNSNPIRDYASFYNTLAGNDKNGLKTHSFTYSDKIKDKYNALLDAIFEVSMQSDEENNQIADEKEIGIEEDKEGEVDIDELKFTSYLDILYDNENRRVIKVMDSLSDKCRYVASNIDTLGKRELTEAQSDILRLIGEAKDKHFLEPRKLLDGAALIFRQLRMNTINDDALNKMTSRL